MKLPPASLRLLVIAFLVTLLPSAAVPTPAAEPPPKDDDIAILRTASDQAVRQYSKGLSTAADELIQKWWWNRAEATNTVLACQQAIRGLRSEAAKHIGEPIPTEYEFLGSRRLGTNCVNFSYLQKHQWLSLPIDIGFIRYDGQWRLIQVFLGDDAEPLVRRLLQVERASDLPAIPAQAPDFLRPVTLADIRQACDTFLDRIAKDQPTRAFKELMQEHWVSPQNSASQTETLESQFRQASPQIVADFGRPLSGKAEFLGLSRLGAHRLDLHYALHYERGMRLYRFAFYKPDRAWRLCNMSVENTPDAEWQKLYTPHSSAALIPTAQRPLLDIASKTVTEIAKSSPTALDEAFRDWWIDPADSPKTQGFLQGYQANLPLLFKVAGPSVANGTLYLGTRELGNDILTVLHMNLREREFIPISTTFLRRDGKWKLVSLLMGAKAYDYHDSLNKYTILGPHPKAGSAPGNLQIPDLALLEKSCHRFMTRVTTGQVKGAISELMATHKPAADSIETDLLQGEANFLMNQFKPSTQIGKPLPGQFEYLGVGSRGPYSTRLVYLQRFEGRTGLWSFLFYRPKSEWLLTEVADPGNPTHYLPKLEVLERPTPAMQPK